VDEYRIVRAIGASAGGRETFLAHDRVLDRPVVLWLLSPTDTRDERRLAGARAIGRVSHPCLCRIHKVRDSRVRPYVVSSFVRGERLSSLSTPLPAKQVLDLGAALAGALAALHAAGVSHGDVRAQCVFVTNDGAPCLVDFDHAHVDADSAARAADVLALRALLEGLADSELSAHLAQITPHRGEAQSAEELRRALDVLARPSLAREPIAENPYRGLRAFDAEHAAVFFGRQGEVTDILSRLAAEPWIVVAGRSGSGRTSFVRAGIIPVVSRGALGEKGRWEIVSVVPGPRPVWALASAFAPVLGVTAERLMAEIADEPARLAGRVRARKDVGTMLVVDQLEDVFTLANEADRRTFLDVLARFRGLAPGVRAVMTLRTDFLPRLAEEKIVGRDLLRAVCLLGPLREEGLREVIVGPARARDVEFETTAMVDALMRDARAHTEPLPLLSFALAELWGARDLTRRVIPAAALDRQGGLAATFARHGRGRVHRPPSGRETRGAEPAHRARRREGRAHPADGARAPGRGVRHSRRPFGARRLGSRTNRGRRRGVRDRA
jgi:tRNA A-37 threonylcarbamoyl transferase component Bud32